MSARDKRLYLEDLTVSFDGFKALNKRSLYVDAGEILCIRHGQKHSQIHQVVAHELIPHRSFSSA